MAKPLIKLSAVFIAEVVGPQTAGHGYQTRLHDSEGVQQHSQPWLLVRM